MSGDWVHDPGSMFEDVSCTALEKTTAIPKVRPFSDETAFHTPEGIWTGSTPVPAAGDLVSERLVVRYLGHSIDASFGATSYRYTGLNDIRFSAGLFDGNDLFVSVQVVPYVVFDGITGTSLADFDWIWPSSVASACDGPGFWEIECVTSVWDSGSSRWLSSFRYRKDGGSWVAITGVILGLGLQFLWDSLVEFTPGALVATITVAYGDESESRADLIDWRATKDGTTFAHGLLPITGGLQLLVYGVGVRFDSRYGHERGNGHGGDLWYASLWAGNIRARPGIGVRGTITEATACINGGFPNNNIMVTSEDDISGHAIKVRDADSLALLGTLSGHAGIATASGERFSFSTNDEGLFFAHFFTTDGKRKIAVIAVDPLTFAPTITEIITLESNSHTGSYYSFANAITAP